MSLIATLASGYRLAWRHRRPLAGVLLPVVAVAAITLLALDLVLGGDRMVIVDGAPQFPGDGGTLPAWARPVVVAAAWLLALSAGALTAAGAERGQPVPPRTALRFAAGRLPILAFGTAVFVAFFVAGLRFVAGAGTVPGLGWLLAAVLVAAQLLLGVIWLGRAPAWQMTRGRRVPTAGAFLVGGLLPLLLAGRAGELVAAVPVAGRLLGAALLVALVAVQAGIVARVHLDLADQEAVRARLIAFSGRPPRWVWPAVLAAVVAVLAPAGVAAANPLGAVTVRSHADTPAGGVAAAAWPPGRHPVLVTGTGVRFCDNDVCDRYDTRSGGLTVTDGFGAAAFSPDGGTVALAAVTGSRADGGPFLHHGTCDRDRCREAWLPTRASAREPFGWPEVDVALAPDRALWFALATPDEQGNRYRLGFIRCADADCTVPARHAAGSVARGHDESRPLVRLTIDAAGRPIATVGVGDGAAVTVTCAPVTCAGPRTRPAGPQVPAQPVATGPGPEAVTDLSGWGIGEQPAAWSGAVTTAGGRTYVTGAVPTGRPGLHVSVGRSGEPSVWQQVLWSCVDGDCRRTALDTFEGTGGREQLVAAPDGRVLVVRPDRMLLVTDARRP